MGIYISGVKGLPEQVQENKEKIKEIQEEIEGIDFDEIRALEDQVAENTQDINNMEGTIGTQNIAITQLGGRVDDLEAKTQEITRDSDNNITQVGEDLHVKGNITLDNAKSIILGNDGHNAIESSGNGNSYFDFDSQDNPEIGSDGNIYKFTDTGITLNGTPVGGATLYQHNIRITSFNYSNCDIRLVIINDSPTAMTREELTTYLSSKYSNDTNKALAVSGTYLTNYIVYKLYTSGNNTYISLVYFDSGNSTLAIDTANSNNNNIYITDNVVQLS
ncbi:MAG: hypothetical protein LIR50_04970 [Bacillota bacterium]|nr:hypothetical protein [Bacillota bacterium]